MYTRDWSADEVEYLIRAYANQATRAEIAEHLGRSLSSVTCKLRLLCHDYKGLETDAFVAAARAAAEHQAIAKAQGALYKPSDDKGKLKRWALEHPVTQEEFDGFCDAYVAFMRDMRCRKAYDAKRSAAELTQAAVWRLWGHIQNYGKEDKDAVKEDVF